ncbi:MAG TPA: GGDEF domain-containing protein [Candidatus Saccharimonadales bacterium]|nr:GGDEF domain-containing protein [Candidatus Saccharimonadales bacterium]
MGDQVDYRLHLSRRFSQAGAGIVGAVVAIRVLALPISPGTRVLDSCLALLAVGIGVLLIRLPPPWKRHRQAASAAGAVALAMVAAVGLRAAATQLPDFTVCAAVAFTAILIGLDTDAPRSISTRPLQSLTRTSWPFAVAAAAGVIAIFVALWLTTAPGSSGVASLIVTAAGMIGIKLLAVGGTERSLAGLGAETRRGHVSATLGRRLGVARDVTSVAAAVLEACREIFPGTSTGMVLINDPTDGLLKSPGAFLSSGGVGSGGPAYELAPGEGLGGAVFVAERAEVWPTTLSASMAQASLREANRVRLRRSKLGFIRSAIGAPLRVDGATIGAILLTSERQENAWTEADAPIIEALADEAARAIERARRHEDEMSRAQLDAVTGMPTRAQLLAVIDKELARASRREGTLALIMADIDGFAELNDRWGHDAGNQVLETFAGVLRSILRREDSAARFGADEFVCVLPGADHDQARAVAARIQQRFTADTSADQGVGRSGATASAGIAVSPTDSQDVVGLLEAASRELATAKASHELTGRSRLRRRVRDAAPS